MTKIYSRAYLLTKVLTASQREVILYLYEGALSLVRRAADARERSDHVAASEAIDRVVSILIELSSCLDYNQNGALALRLDSIYHYMIDALTLSTRKGDDETLRVCESIFTILGDAWRQAIASEHGAERPAPAPLQMSA